MKHLPLIAILGLLGAIAFAPSSSAQSAYNPIQEVENFKARFGEQIGVVSDSTFGFVKMIYGKGADLRTPFQLRTESDYEAAAREIFDSFPGLFGYDSDALVLREISHLDLSDLRTENKVAVTFDQVVKGVEVDSASASVLFDSSGRILCISNDALPGVQDRPELLEPAVAEDQALRWAAEAFGHEIGEVRRSEFKIDQVDGDVRPVWIIELRATDMTEELLPIQEEIIIDAQTGQVASQRSTIYHVDLTGNTDGFATPGDAPDSGSNPPVLFPVAYASMNSPVGSAITDLDGDWTIPYAGTNDQDVTVDFGASSQFAEVIDIAGPEISLTQSVTPGTPAQFTLNSSPTEYDTAEMNAQRHVILFREYIKSVAPQDQTMDFPVLANVNINSSCNAYYDGSSINFFRESGGCANTSYSSVVAHEEGHWANVRYNAGVSGAFHEGAADIWAMYIYDTNIVGRDFCGPGCHVRDGNNTLQKCGSGCDETCHGGQVHREGQVLMGTFWKLRTRLNSAYGDAAGDAMADDFFIGWMRAFDDRRICDEIYTHILILDDDDGNITNGTPNCDIIAAAFEGDHGWPDIHDCSPPQDCPPPCQVPTSYGVGTPGTGGVIPQLATSNGCGYLGNQNLSIDLSNALAGAPGSFLVGFASDNTDMSGWTRLVMPSLIVPFTTSGTGTMDLIIKIPVNPFLIGLDVYIQGTISDPGAPSGISASNGVQFEICDPN